MSFKNKLSKEEYAENLLQKLSDLREMELFLDVTVKVRNRSYKAHGILLIAFSDHFRSVLLDDSYQAMERCVFLDDLDSDSVMLCIDFMYEGKIAITAENLRGLTQASGMLGIPKLTNFLRYGGDVPKRQADQGHAMYAWSSLVTQLQKARQKLSLTTRFKIKSKIVYLQIQVLCYDHHGLSRRQEGDTLVYEVSATIGELSPVLGAVAKSESPVEFIDQFFPVNKLEIPDQQRRALNLMKALDASRSDGFSNFVIKAGKEKFPVHRVVVAACSEYFKLLFIRESMEKRDDSHRLEGVEPRVVQKCIDFMYTGEMDTTEDEDEVNEVVSKLVIKELIGTFEKSRKRKQSVTEHALYLQSAIKKLKNRELTCDFRIKVGHMSFLAHRGILAARTEYFRAMVSHDMKEMREGFVDMKGVEPDGVLRCIEYMYTGEIRLTVQNANNTLYAAMLFLLTDLSELCLEFLKNNLSVRNCLQIRQIALSVQANNLYSTTLTFIGNNFEKVTQMNDLTDLTEKEIFRLFGVQETKNCPEIAKWKAALKWVGKDPGRVGIFPGLLKCINLRCLSRGFVRKKVLAETLVRESVECKKMVKAALREKKFSQIAHIAILNKETGKIHVKKPPSGRWRELLDFGSSKVWSEGGKSGKNPQARKLVYLGREIYLLTDKGFFQLLRNGKWEAKATMARSTSELVEPFKLATFRGCVYYINDNVVAHYDPLTDRWTNDAVDSGELGHWSYRACVATTLENIYLLGVHCTLTYTGASRLAQKYDPIKNKWSYIAPMTNHRMKASAASLKGKIYVLGGWSRHRERLSSAEFYDPNTNSWTCIANMHYRRQDLHAFVADGRIYAVGGTGKTLEERYWRQPKEKGSIEVFHHEQDRWETVCPKSSKLFPDDSFYAFMMMTSN